MSAPVRQSHRRAVLPALHAVTVPAGALVLAWHPYLDLCAVRYAGAEHLCLFGVIVVRSTAALPPLEVIRVLGLQSERRARGYAALLLRACHHLELVP